MLYRSDTVFTRLLDSTGMWHCWEDWFPAKSQSKWQKGSKTWASQREAELLHSSSLLKTPEDGAEVDDDVPADLPTTREIVPASRSASPNPASSLYSSLLVLLFVWGRSRGLSKWLNCQGASDLQRPSSVILLGSFKIFKAFAEVFWRFGMRWDK